MVNKTPRWINTLLHLRNNSVKPLGLKNVGLSGGLKHSDYTNKQSLIGMQLDIFHIRDLTLNEMVLALNDKHLDIKISIIKARDDFTNKLIIGTCVKYNNYLYQVYMNLILSFHKIIVKRSLRVTQQSLVPG
jgi:hypothetical protein